MTPPPLPPPPPCCSFLLFFVFVGVVVDVCRHRLQVKFSRSGDLLLSLGTLNNRIAVYDWRSDTVVATVEGGNLPVLDVSFAADANLFLQCGVESIKFHRFHGRNVQSEKAILGAGGVLQTFPCVTCFGNFPIVGTEDGHLCVQRCCCHNRLVCARKVWIG